MKRLIGHCPHCGDSENIRTVDIIYANAGIAGWTVGDDGSTTHEYDGETDIDWDTQQPVDVERPYGCFACYGSNFGIGDMSFDEEK